MNSYKIDIKFKNGKDLGFDMGSDEDLRKVIASDWSKCMGEGGMQLGEHIINPREILWMKVKGEIVAKPSRETIPSIREEKQ